MKATEVVKLIKNTNRWAVISAEKSRFADPTNHMRHLLTLQLLSQLGLGPVEGRGRYEGHDERSIFLPNIEFGTALALGKVLDQESVLLPAGLVYVDGGRVVPMRGDPKFLKETDEAEAFTEIEGRRFVCPLRW